MSNTKENKAELKKDFVLILMPAQTKDKIKELARNEERSLSNYCLSIINNFLKMSGDTLGKSQ